MRTIHVVAASGMALVIGACGGPDAYYYDPYGVPDYSGLGLDPSGYCDPATCWDYGSGYTGANPQSPLPSDAPCGPADTACVLRMTGTAVNADLQAVLGLVDELLNLSPSRAGDIAVFGPRDLAAPGREDAAAATFRLTLRQGEPDGSSWSLEAKPVGASDAEYVRVFTGAMRPGEEPRRGRGVLGIDLDALAGVNATAFPGKGRILGSFASDRVAKATALHLIGFQATVASAPLPDAVLESATDENGHSHATLSGPAAPLEAQAQDATAPISPATSGGPARSLVPGAPPTAMPDAGP